MYFKYFYQLVLKLNHKFLNLNTRELQPNSQKKYPQFRVKLKYVATHLLPLNPYKIAILRKNKINDLSDKESKKHIDNRFEFYENFILNKSDLNVKELRKRIGFEKDENKNSRDTGIIKMARISFRDLCAACSRDYAIENRSFKTRTGVYYLEAHHNLSFSSDPLKHDVLENIVPLCPTCHKALGKNKADESFQKSLIKNILEFSSDAKEFAQNVSQLTEENQLIDYIYEALK